MTKTLLLALGLFSILLTRPARAATVSWIATSAPATNWASVACSADGSKIVAGHDAGIYISADFGSNWAPAMTPPLRFPAVACSADGTKMVAGAGTNNCSGGGPPIALLPFSYLPTQAPPGCQAVRPQTYGSALPARQTGRR